MRSLDRLYRFNILMYALEVREPQFGGGSEEQQDPRIEGPKASH